MSTDRTHSQQSPKLAKKLPTPASHQPVSGQDLFPLQADNIHHTAASKQKMVGTILQLQRLVGNQAVNRMLNGTHENTLLRKPIPQRTPNSAVIQRGEAPVHEGIETEATDVSDEKLLKEMYAGNWMRDFSQLNLAMPHSLVQKLPRNLDKPTGATIGPQGAEDIVTAVIRGLAFLHFGPEITNELITPANIGTYTPEQHVDNPMGTTATELLVRDSDTGLLRPGTPQYTTENASTAPAQVFNEDADRDAQIRGKAFPGLQIENPELFKVSDAGLGRHIYNAIEWTKQQLWSAVSAGQSPQGRMYLGSALHAVEDYFAHSNFIEVALNSEIERAMAALNAGKDAGYSANFLSEAEKNKHPEAGYVDTLYDATSPDGRKAVTTGTAGKHDLKVSIGQILLPKLPALSKMINQKIDETFKLVKEGSGKTTWQKIQEHLKTDNGGHAMLEVMNALDRHIQVTVYDIWLTGIDIPFTDRFIPTGFDTSTSTKGVASAIEHYIDLHASMMRRLEEMGAVLKFAFPMVDLMKRFMDLINEKIDELKQAIIKQVTEFLLRLVEDITGLDLKEEKKKGLDYALNYAATVGVEHIREGTSLQSQLPDIKKEHENDPVKLWQVYGIYEGEPQFALPPSHSEISKDHPPHEDEHHAPVDSLHGYDMSEGSLFFRLHKELAVEADEHIIQKLQEVWDEQQQANSIEGLNTSPRLNPDEVIADARKQQAREVKRAAKEGRNLETYGFGGQTVQDLMALVDYFISHPDDTTWWKPILSNYVNKHEAEVILHIQQRNQTRDKRN